jgi:aminoglycoside phosphotransferase (APT) family kinase protein
MPSSFRSIIRSASDSVVAAEPERGHGWLSAVVPAEARRFRVEEPALAAGLKHAGAEVTSLTPDVEIGRLGYLRGDAAVSVAVIGYHPRGGDKPLPIRATRRLVNSARTRLAARRAVRMIERLGYADVHVLRWDYHQNLQTCRGGRRMLRPLQEYLPERALVLGRRALMPSLLEAVLSEAARAAGAALRAGPPSIRTGLLISETTQGMLRVAVGFGAAQIGNQRSALAVLDALEPPQVIADRVPWEIGGGRCRLAEWSLERRLPGHPARPPVDGRLLADCVDFLVALHGSSQDGAPSTLMQQARSITRVVRGADAQALLALAERLTVDLSDVPRGFAHGDFFHGNVLVEDGRLTGVVDWDAAGPGRLPLVDLLHLRHATVSLPEDEWGLRIVQQLLPWARAGGDEVAQDYCARVGFSPDNGQLEALILGYWLDRLASQLDSHAHRLAQPVWLKRNIRDVLRAVAPGRAHNSCR